MRTCRACNRDLPLDQFRPLPPPATGYRRQCKGCEEDARRARRAGGRAAQVAPASSPAPVRSPSPSAPGGVRIYAVLSDVHVPYQDRRAVAGVCDYLRDLQPHGLILNGDILDLDEISRHNAGSVANLEGKRISRTWREGNAFLDVVISSCGSRLDDIRWVDGNHEDRIARWLAQADHAVFADDLGFDIAGRLRFAERGIKHFSGYPDAHTTLGKLLITHGTVCGKYAPARHLDKYRHSVLFGHTHTPGMYYASGMSRTAAYNNGHLADVLSPALSYAATPNAWAQGFAVVHVRTTGEFQVQLIQLWNGQFHVGDRTYGGSRAPE